MKRFVYPILYLALTIGYGQLYSQHSIITGQIVDYDTKEPIPGLTLHFNSKNANLLVGEGINTDREGKFSLSHNLHDTVNLFIDKRIGYSTLTIVKDIYSTTNIDIGKIFHIQRSDIICALPDVTNKKTRKALKRENKVKDSISAISTDNSTLIIKCASNKSYKIIITNGTAIIEFKDILNCQN